MSDSISYSEALDYLFAQLPMFSRIGAAAYKPGLGRVVKLSSFFGNPERQLKVIHVAGTNGKGSTSHLIASVLQACGYKTALYTSPHLIDFRERIKIDGKMIPEEKVVEFVRKWKNSAYEGDRPSFFELTMMMAFDWFASEKVDYAVIEVGMGGRLDSTNIVSPLLSVITNISPDHTQFLGHTLTEIATEKAGIIKEGVPVVIGEADADVEAVFHAKADEMGAPIVDVYKNPPAKDFKLKEDYSGWRAYTPLLGEFEFDLAGEYQKKNISTALAAVLELKKMGISLPPDKVKAGLQHAAETTGLTGRWTILSKKPLTICDTGHNIGGLSVNTERLRNLMKQRVSTAHLRILVGFVSDKAVDEILDLFPKEAVYYITNADIPRAMPATDLLEKFKSHGLSGNAFPNVKEAWERIKEDTSEEDVIYIGGSTFIVADFLKL